MLNRELIANEKLVLKVGAKVMFIYNVNDRIKNGVQGTVTSFLNGLPVVTTSNGTEGDVVERVTWSVYDRMDIHKLGGRLCYHRYQNQRNSTKFLMTLTMSLF